MKIESYDKVEYADWPSYVNFHKVSFLRIEFRKFGGLNLELNLILICL
jgi:hypothetical protein